MRSDHDELTERRLGRMLTGLAEATPAPEPAELARMARAATARPRPVPRRRLRAAVPTAVLATAAVVAVGVGLSGGDEAERRGTSYPIRTDLVSFPEGDSIAALVPDDGEERP